MLGDNKNLGAGIFMIGAGFLAGGLAYFSLKQIIKNKKLSRLDEQSKILTLSELKNAPKKTNIFVKGVVDINPTQKITKPLKSNMKYFCQPSEIPVVKQFVYNLSKANQNMKWKLKSEEGNHSIKVKGFGQILDLEIVNVQKQVKNHQIGFFRSIFVSISYFLQLMVDWCRNKSKLSYEQNRGPIFSGLTIGQIIYQLTFFTNTSIILKCMIDDNGELIPQYISGSKQIILNETNRQQIYYLLIAGSIFSLMLILRQIYRIFRKIIKNARQKFPEKGLFNPADIPDSNYCIACYDSCRNAVFMDCRHLVQCAACSKDRRVQTCPICKQPISQIKLIYKQ